MTEQTPKEKINELHKALIDPVRLGACPNRITTPEHFARKSGPCDCFDPSASYMANEHEWTPKLQRWINKEG